MAEPFTMCRDTGCPIRHSCRRYRCTPMPGQSWFVASPWGAKEPNACWAYASVGDGKARDLRSTEHADHENRLAVGASR